MRGEHFDVVVVGGGVSGLAAAGGIARSGRRVLLAEARDRLGGRIHTRREPGWPVPIESGAEFVHGTIPQIGELAGAGGAALVEIPQRHLLQGRQGPRRADDLFMQAIESSHLTRKRK